MWFDDAVHKVYAAMETSASSKALDRRPSRRRVRALGSRCAVDLGRPAARRRAIEVDPNHAAGKAAVADPSGIWVWGLLVFLNPWF